MKKLLLLAALLAGCAGPAPAVADAAPSDADAPEASLRDAADDARADVFVADAAPDAPACSGHGTLHNDHCDCDPGYRAQGLACVAIDRCPEDDRNEPNDSAAQATRLDAGSPAAGRRCASDTDTFVVRASMGQRLVVDLAFRHADGDLDLLLYEPGRDPRVDRAIARSESADDDEQVAHRARVDGDFLVVVTGAESAAQAPYTITATLQP
jgi:hypothetical protein